MIFYFDTSAINYVKERLTPGDAIATRGFQEVRGRRWSLSPVAIWEILNTTRETRREELIFLSQNLFAHNLLASPEELLVSYIRKGCPEREKTIDLTSSSQLADTWREVCADTRKTLLVDGDELRRRFNMVATITRDLHHLTRHREIALDRYASHIGWDVSLEGMVNNLSWIRNGDSPTPFERRLYKLSVFYILFLLCAEIGVDPEPVKKFWNDVGLQETVDRARYILANYEVLVHRGPIIVMAYMTIVQAAKKFSRGVYWDSLHAFYLPYVNYMLSEDQDFVELKSVLPSPPNAEKIQKPSEMQWQFHERSNPAGPQWLA